MQRFKYVADLVKKKKEKDVEEALETELASTQVESISSPVQSTSTIKSQDTTEEALPECVDVNFEDTKDDTRPLGKGRKKQKARKRKNRARDDSFSSNSSVSDSEWCVVDSPTQSN